MLKLDHINKKLGRFALTGINIEIPAGEYFVLLGRSGSGKTQLLELIAGLTVPDSGRVLLNGRDITHDKIQDRHIGLVFQDYAIFPNMTVFGNIAYPLHSRRIKKKEITEKVRKVAEEMNITGILDRFTQNLSGGELQRVALARTLVNSPELLLLDEPMASIDASLKDGIKRMLRQLNKKGMTIIHVTHDYREAVSLASKVGVIHNGHIIQSGTPELVFGRPVNKFVARYAGIRNFFRVRFKKENDKWKAHCGRDLVFNVAGSDYPAEGLVLLKSDSISISGTEPVPGNDNTFRGVVMEINPSEYGIEIAVQAGEMFYVDLPLTDFRELDISESSDVWLSFRKEDVIPLKGTA